MAGLQFVSSFAGTVPVSAVISWPAQSSWSFTEKTALDCPLLTAVHGVAVTPSSCLSTSCSNFFACPDIIMRFIIVRWTTSHRLSSVPGFTAFPPPLLLTLLENPGKGTASPRSAGVSGDILLGSSADPSGIVLWEQTHWGSLWLISRSPGSTDKDCCSRCQSLKQKCRSNLSSAASQDYPVPSFAHR